MSRTYDIEQDDYLTLVNLTTLADSNTAEVIQKIGGVYVNTDLNVIIPGGFIFSRTGTTITPKTAGDNLDMSGGDVTSDDININGLSGSGPITSTSVETVLENIDKDFVAMKEPTGFPNRTSSAWTFTDGTRKLAITVVSGSYNIFFGAISHTISTTKEIEITDVEGIHMVYFDTDDTLKEYENPTEAQILVAITTKCLVAIIYWDATNKSSVLYTEERHGTVMDGITHYYLHYTRGLQYVSGFALGGFVIGDGSLDTHAQFSIGEGMLADEDIGLTSSPIASTTGLPILYKYGVNGYWRRTTQAGFAVKQSGTATNRLYYNKNTAGTWSLAEVGEANYVLCHVYMYSGKTEQVFAIMGEAEYTTLNTARAGAQAEIANINLGNLPSPEIRPIATVIFQTDKDYGNTINARVVEITSGGDDYVSWLTTDLPRGVTPSDHQSLSNLQLAQSGITYGHINDDTQSIAGAKTFSSAVVATTSLATPSILDNGADITIENNTSDKDIIFKVNDGGVDTEIMRIDGSASNVGIGTTSPTGKLTIDADNSASNNLILRDTRTYTEAPSTVIKYQAHGTTDASYNDLAYIAAYKPAGNTNNGALSFATNAGSGTTSRMTIDKDGNVGIGTTSPSAKLDVNGVILSSQAGGNFPLQHGNLAIGQGGNTYSRGFSTGAMGIFNINTTAQDIYLYNKNGADAGVFVLKADGNVGIGTTSPGDKLEVNGNIRLSSGGVYTFATNSGVYAYESYGFNIKGTTNYPVVIPSSSLLVGYSSSAGTTYGTNNLYVAGNVGIGTTSPAGKLNIVGDASNYGVQSDVLSGNAALTTRVIGKTYGWSFIPTTNGSYTDLQIGVWDAAAAGVKIIFQSTGNVGIGTTSPGAKLDVNGAILSGDQTTKYVNAYTIAGTSQIGDGTTGGYILLAKAYVSGTQALSELDGKIYLSRGSSSQGHRTTIYNVYSKSSYNSEKLYVSALQNNGWEISTCKITYNSVIYHALKLSASAGGGAYNSASFTGNIGGTVGLLGIPTTSGSSESSFGTYGIIQDMDAGNVGIGTTAPTAKLDLGTGYGANGQKFLIYNDDTSSALAGTKVGYYMDNIQPNNVNFIFPTHSANPGLYTIGSKDTSGTTFNYRFAIAGQTGNVGIGTTSPANPLHVESSFAGFISQIKNTRGSASTDSGLLVETSTTAGKILSLKNSGTEHFYIAGSGAIYAPSMGSGAGTYAVKWNSSTKEVTYDASSLRYKTNLRPIFDTSRVLDLTPKLFDRKDDGTKDDFGFIAEEVQEIMPELVVYRNNVPDGIKYDRMCIVLLEEIKKLRAEVNQLKGGGLK